MDEVERFISAKLVRLSEGHSVCVEKLSVKSIVNLPRRIRKTFHVIVL